MDEVTCTSLRHPLFDNASTRQRLGGILVLVSPLSILEIGTLY